MVEKHSPHTAPQQTRARVQPTQTEKPKSVRKFLALPHFSKQFLIASVAVILAMAIIVVPMEIAQSKHPFAKQIVSSTDFPLYYPSKLPAGYTFNKSQASFANGVIIFTVTAPGGKTIDVSEEATPSGFDFSQIQGSDTFRTSAGQVVINYNQSFTSASIAGTQTWTLVRATSAVTTADLTTLLSNFKPIGM